MYIENKIEKNVLLKPFTTYQLGGPADYFVRATTQNELVESIQYATTREIPYFVLGTGANILFGDKGFRGLVIKNETKNFRIEHWGHVICLIAESGVLISDIIDATVKKNYSGFEHFAGIPSTVGGAIWQNLHFLSPDRKRTVFIEEVFSHGYVYSKSENNIRSISKKEMLFGYDTSILHQNDLVLLEATFILHQSTESILKIKQENIAWRNQKHPPYQSEFSCGSVFKKIKDVGAGRLIESSGLKGYSLGGAIVSNQHANFITHTGAATAADVRNLIDLIQRVVFEKTGYQLETEIGFVGEF